MMQNLLNIKPKLSYSSSNNLFSIQISIKSLSKKSLDLFNTFLFNCLKALNFNFCFSILPVKKRVITLLKSPHVNKTSKEQFEIKLFHSIFIVEEIKISEIENLKCLFINKPKSVEIQIKVLEE